MRKASTKSAEIAVTFCFRHLCFRACRFGGAYPNGSTIALLHFLLFLSLSLIQKSRQISQIIDFVLLGFSRFITFWPKIIGPKTFRRKEDSGKLLKQNLV